jgi:CHRD domain
MNGRLKLASAAAVAVVAATAGTVAVAGGGNGIREELSGYQEVPAVSTAASGKFRAEIRSSQSEIEYKLSYADLEGDVTQAHIHFGQRAVNGGIVVWLCANNPPITTAPAGTQACPAAPATITGTITPDNVQAVTAQGFAAGEFDELLAAIEAGVTYANVHSTTFPGGEIRGQLESGEGDGEGEEEDDD